MRETDEISSVLDLLEKKGIKNDNELVAVFEIKIEKVSPSAFEKSIKDFEDLKNLSPRPLIFYIIFWPPEKNKKKKNRHEGLELIMEFFNKYNDGCEERKAFLITKFDIDPKGEEIESHLISLNEAIDKIVEEIKK